MFMPLSRLLRTSPGRRRPFPDYYTTCSRISTNQAMALIQLVITHLRTQVWKKMMTWKTINALLGLATVDEEFRRALLADPLAAAQARHFELTTEEQEAFKSISATSLSEFSQQIVTLLGKKP